MDEIFWANVVKRWSDASETVLKLKKELAEVQEEREMYRDIVQTMRKSGALRAPSRSRVAGHTRDESIKTIVVDEDYAGSSLQNELKDAEIGFGRAKEEYRRLQKELSESAERVRALTLENKRLVTEHQSESENLQEERRRFKETCKDLEALQSKNEILDARVHQLEQDLKLLNTFHGQDSAELTPRPSFVSPPWVQHQVVHLKQELESKCDNCSDLQHKLGEAQEKLRKAEDNNQNLMNTIKKLQEITRQSTGALQAISANFSTTSSRPRRFSLSSSSHYRIPSSGAHSRKVSTSSAPDISGEVVVSEKASEDSDITHVLLPSGRQHALGKLPIVDTAEADSENLFERDFLKDVLGSLTQRSTEKLDSMDRKTATSYLCPTINHHPWCPSTPGQHGYIFVGLGKEKDTYKSPAIRHLFVGLPKTKTRNRRFRYLGQYRVMRVRSLSVEEWGTLPEEVKLMFAKLTKDKTKDSRTPEELLEAYDDGSLSVPCVLMQCISFDKQLYEMLLSQRDAESP